MSPRSSRNRVPPTAARKVLERRVMAARADGARIETVSTTRASSLRHVRPVQPLRFPEQEPDEERMGQGRRHRHPCEALYQMLRAVCVPEHTVGADQARRKRAKSETEANVGCYPPDFTSFGTTIDGGGGGAGHAPAAFVSLWSQRFLT